MRRQLVRVGADHCRVRALRRRIARHVVERAQPATGSTVSGDVSLANSPRVPLSGECAVAPPDPRIGLKPGAAVGEAGEAAWNMRLLSNSPATEGFTGRGATGSDLAFTGKYAIQGNYRGFQIWDISNPRAPTLVVGFLCPTSQGDPTVYRQPRSSSPANRNGSRNDCGTTNITDTVSMDRFRGIRVVDISRQGASAGRHEHPDVPRIAHQHARAAIRATRTTSTSTCPATRRCARRTKLPDCHDRSGRRFDERAVPHRGHQGAARASGAGEGRELAAPAR